MRKCLYSTVHLCVKEVNLLLRNYALKFGEDKIKYTDFLEDLFTVRFDLLRSRLMDINVMNWNEKFLLECGGDKLIDGCRMHIADVKMCLGNSKELTLFANQINNLIGHAELDDRQTIDVAVFGKALKPLIERMYTVEALRRKAQLIQFGQFRAEVVQVPEYEDLDLFRVFRDFDENQKGFLDTKEYAHCLEKFEALGLNMRERTYISLVADINLNGRIDYQEFMKHFSHTLYNLKYNDAL